MATFDKWYEQEHEVKYEGEYDEEEYEEYYHSLYGFYVQRAVFIASTWKWSDSVLDETGDNGIGTNMDGTDETVAHIYNMLRRDPRLYKCLDDIAFDVSRSDGHEVPNLEETSHYFVAHRREWIDVLAMVIANL